MDAKGASSTGSSGAYTPIADHAPSEAPVPSPKVEHGLVTCFDDDEAASTAGGASASLRRAVTVVTILSGLAAHWSSNQGSQSNSHEALVAQYDLSLCVKRIDYFLSHSWRTGRWLKYASLVVFFNAIPAATFSFLLSLLIGFLQWQGYVPLLWAVPFDLSATGMKVDTIHLDVGAVIVMEGICFVALVSFHIWKDLFGFRGFCFLDKLCICQHDPSLKNQGISALGAFMSATDTLVVLWSQEYFSRLWCAYELAVFCYLQTPRQKMDYMPVTIAKVSVIAYIVFIVTAFNNFGAAAGVSPAVTSFGILGNAVVTLVMVDFLSTYAEESRDMAVQLRDFSMRNTECFAETDRTHVYEKIKDWFGDGDMDAGLNKFDEYVRTSVRTGMLSIVGLPGSFPVRLAMVVNVGSVILFVSIASGALSFPWSSAYRIMVFSAQCYVVEPCLTILVAARSVAWFSTFETLRNWPHFRNLLGLLSILPINVISATAATSPEAAPLLVSFAVEVAFFLFLAWSQAQAKRQ